MAIKNIIFDLGGVLLNIDFLKTEKAFVDLGIKNFGELYTQFHASPLFIDYETGRIDDKAFMNAIRESTGTSLKDEEIITAWNALLLDFPVERLSLLENLAKKYRLFLLSNTNALHHHVFQQTVLAITGNKTFDSYFEKAYYSHAIGMRKPDLEIYEWVLKQNNLLPNETLFIDDTLSNVEAARKVGLEAIHLQKPMTVADLDL